MRKTFSKDDKEFILLQTGYRCACCGKKLNINNMTVEHMIPLSRGGTNKINNLLALCFDCNQEKSNDLIPFHYVYAYYFFSKEQNEENWDDLQEMMDRYTIYIRERFDEKHSDLSNNPLFCNLFVRDNYKSRIRSGKRVTMRERSTYFSHYLLKIKRLDEYNMKKISQKIKYDIKGDKRIMQSFLKDVLGGYNAIKLSYGSYGIYHFDNNRLTHIISILSDLSTKRIVVMLYNTSFKKSQIDDFSALAEDMMAVADVYDIIGEIYSLYYAEKTKMNMYFLGEEDRNNIENEETEESLIYKNRKYFSVEYIVGNGEYEIITSKD